MTSLIVPTVPAQCYNRRPQRRNDHAILTRQTIADVRALIGDIKVQFMHQQHSGSCVEISKAQTLLPKADASVTSAPRLALSVYTADCVPILLASDDGIYIGAIHAGWRGLFHDVIRNTLHSFQQPTTNFKAWLGPAISQRCYQVNDDFKAKFCQRHPSAQRFFSRDSDCVFFDCSAFAEWQLRQCGVQNIQRNHQCTFLDAKLPSYRQSNGRLSERILSLIWRQ